MSFFSYTCDQCGAAVCDRVQLMNMALDNVEDLYCLSCLSDQHEQIPSEMADFARSYIASRSCFLTPWKKFDAKPCPLIPQGECYCQDA